MDSFLQYRSTKKLTTLAKEPLDFTKNGVLTPQRVEEKVLTNETFDLLYGTERVTDEVMEALYELAKEAKVQEKMRAMQAGEILNQIEGVESEKRPVLH